MIEQQLKLKQATGQQVAMPAGKWPTRIITINIQYIIRCVENKILMNIFLFSVANGNPQAQMAVMPQQQQQQMQQAAGAGGADYSKQWAEYYRSVGKNDEAEAIEKQLQAMKVSPVDSIRHPCIDFNMIFVVFVQNSGQSPSNGGHASAAPVGNYNNAQPGGNYSNQQYQQFYGNAGQNNYGAPHGYGGYGYPNASGQPQAGNDKNWATAHSRWSTSTGE